MSKQHVKVNVDAAYFENERAGAAQCKFLTHAADVVTSEALAMRDGLAFAYSLGFP